MQGQNRAIKCSEQSLVSKSIDIGLVWKLRSLAYNLVAGREIIKPTHYRFVMSYHMLKQVCAEGVSLPMMDQLEGYYRANAGRGLLLSGELIRILGLLKEKEIRSVPVRGPVLASQLHDRPELRQMSGLYLMVPKPDLASVEAVLNSEGYESLGVKGHF